MCFSTSSRSTTSAGAPGRPRRRLCGWRLTRASYTAAMISSSSSTASARIIQGSHRSATSSAINPSAKASCARRRSSTALALRSPAVALGNQQLVVELADRLDGLFELLVVAQPPPHLVGLLCPQAELPRLAAGIADSQHRHRMALATGTLGTSAAMPDEPLDQRPAHDLAVDWQPTDQSCAPLNELLSFHLYK